MVKPKVDADLKAALLAGDKEKVNVIRSLKAAILEAEVAGRARDTGLPDAELQKVVQREIKKRRESVEIYRANNREDLASAEEKEIEVLTGYLPEQLSEDEIKTVIDGIIAEMGEVALGDIGRAIGAVKSKVGSSADGATVARLVKEKLTR